MTIWCYRDGVLASDSQIQFGTLKTGSIKKVHKSKDGWLAAGAGTMSHVEGFFKWVEDGRDSDSSVKFDDLEGVIISPRGEVFHVEGDLIPFSFEADWHAGGSGAEIAFGAMAMGASAVEAVEIAIKYNTGCGGEIQVVELSVPKLKGK